MKRFLLALIVILILFFIGTYFFLPARTSISTSVSIHANPSVTTRILRDDNWKRWWPHNHLPIQDSSFEFNNLEFVVNEKLYKGLQVEIRNEKNSLNTSLNIIPLSLDSVKLDWEGTSPVSYSPFKRIQHYTEAREIQRGLKMLLDTLKLYLQNQSNTYGIQIVEERVKDTLLVTTKSASNSYPSLSTVYVMIRLLRDYINKEGLEETNYPMLHVMPLGKETYSTMVAIPVNKEGAADIGIAYKRMAPGKILVTEVKGGPYTIKTAFLQFDQYLQDYHRISPAIPFESLVTERIIEPDTSKWVTKIYYPVF